MVGSFTGQNMELWGFSLTYEQEPIDDISKVKASFVEKIVHGAYELDLEMHFLPHASIPFVLIKTPSNMWHYFKSEKDAIQFRTNILIDGYKPCWQFI